MSRVETWSYRVIAFSWAYFWLGFQLWLLRSAHALPALSGGVFRLRDLRVSPAFASELLLFLVAVFGLYTVFAGINLSAFRWLLMPRFRLVRVRVFVLITQLSVVTITLHLLNARFYESAASGDVFSLFLASKSGLALLAVLIGLLVCYFSVWVLLRLGLSPWWRRAACGVILAALLKPLMGFVWAAGDDARFGQASDKPNIVIVGIDSLRPDHLSTFGAPFQLMPNLESEISRGVVFSDALVAQAHTFPSTISVLTGLWPTNSGARGNLFPPEVIKSKSSIAVDLQRIGYNTIIAMDETRFANIDSRYGVGRVIGPGMGAIDFAMSLLSDNVLLNLSANTYIGKVVFPNVYGNRALDYIYDPNTFSSLLREGVYKSPSPIFLYAHFCGAHWPYRSSSIFRGDEYARLLEGEYADTNPAYLRSLGQVDSQIGALMATLRSRGILENALVFFLSDHGEDFDMRKDVLSNAKTGSAVSLVRGHGGSAFRAPQVQVLLAVQKYRNGKGVLSPGGVSDAPVSLVDIAPTVAQIVGLYSNEFDGISLFRTLSGQWPNDRTRFVESSFFPAALNAAKIDEKRVLSEAAEMYELVSNGRVQVKQGYLDHQIKYRQRAVFFGNWVLALDEMGRGDLIVIDRSKKVWWKIEDAPSAVPVVKMRISLCQHWADDAVVRKVCTPETGVASSL